MVESLAGPLLAFQNLRAGYGEAVVLDDISFEIAERGSLAVLGRNGVGKSTLLLTLMGFTQLRRGSILWRGADITRLAPHRRARLGLGRTFQVTTLFRNLSVLDNVALAVAERRGDAQRMWRPASSHKEIIAESRDLLATLGLADDAATRAQDLPYGKQRLVEVAVALGLRPKVLLLDEPAAGVPSADTEKILRHLEKLSADIAILIIEHDMDLVFRFAQRITVLVQGQVLVEGTPESIAADRRVRDVYLGEATHG